MKKINYFEIIALFYSGIFDQIKQGIDFNSAIAIEFDSSWQFPEEEHRLSNFIILIHCLSATYALRKAFTMKEIELFRGYHDITKYEELQLSLNQEELEHLDETIYNLNFEINNFMRDNPKN